jgi:hypothetical protein
MTQLSALIALKITITSLFNYLKFKITLQSNKIRLTLYFINPIPIIIIVTITIITQIKSIINIKIIIISASLIIIASTIIQTLITVQVCMIRKL